MIEDLVVASESRIPVVWFVTHEEARAEAEIRMLARQTGSEYWIWSLTSNKGRAGWQAGTRKKLKDGTDEDVKIPFDAKQSASPEGAVQALVQRALDLERENQAGDDTASSKIIAVMRDPHVFLRQNMSFIRALRDASRALKDTWVLLVCLSPVDQLPEDLRSDVEVIHPGLPTRKTLKMVMKEQLGLFEQPQDELDGLVEACVGMTVKGAADALAKSMAKYGRVDLDYIASMKTEAINAVPGLKYIGDAPSMQEVGGLDGLKEWLEERKRGFSEEARQENLPYPKGILCIGVPGCGKSLLAKAAASFYGVPLVELNPPDLKEGIVGRTEGNIRLMKSSVESLGNCVIWIDEFEKGVQRAGEINSDGGTSSALLDGLLNWMQERKGGAFVVATANDISALPPELLRKGRFDSIFFVDLPTRTEREEIFRIHLGKRGWELSDEDIHLLSGETDGYSGAEIEAACIDGKWKAFGRGEKLAASDILECIKADKPLSEMMDGLEDLRRWAKDKARSASKPKTTKVREKKEVLGGTRKIPLKSMEKIDG